MKITQNKQFWIFSLIAISIYAIIWLNLAWPYRPFPYDDILTFHKGEVAHLPLFIFSLEFFKFLLSAFSNDEISYLLVHGIVSNSLSLFLLSAIVCRLTQNMALVVLSILLYGTSAWPANYYFMASYTPWATMLSLLIFLLIIEAYLRYNHSITASHHTREKYTPVHRFLTKRYEPFLILAAIVCILYFLSSSSALLMIIFQILLMGYLFSQSSFISALKNVKLKHAKAALAILSLFAILYLAIFDNHTLSLLSHWYHNIYTSHYTDALAKLGYVPEPPFFSLFHIAYTYNPFLSILFVVVSGITLFFLAFKYYKKSPFSAFEKVLMSLIVVIYAHSIAIDILPFTKLARTHFVVYPLIIIVFLVSFYYLMSQLEHHLRRIKPYLIVFALGACAFIIMLNIAFSKEMIYVRKYTADYLTSLPAETQFYMLSQDIHADSIKYWLGLPIKKIDRISQINDNKHSGFIAIIIGPHGKDSGKSILRHSTFDDFILTDVVKPKGVKEVKLPYYAYFPSFLFEEEISQALFFAGKTPDYKADNMQITVWLIGEKK